jgi:hypothetical protein
MTNNYLGEEFILIENSPFKSYTELDWIEYFITRYGSIDGSEHKAWLLDQIMRIRFGTKLIVKKATWDNHAPEYRISLGEASEEYIKWVNSMTLYYDYNYGIPP